MCEKTTSVVQLNALFGHNESAPMTAAQLTAVLESMSAEELERLTQQLFAGKSQGELEGGLKGTCSGCPFNEGLTENATRAQNYGCLPTAGEILQMQRSSGHNWACHDDETQVCAGLCHSAKREELSLAGGGLIRYSTWYHKGPEEALAEAAGKTI